MKSSAFEKQNQTPLSPKQLRGISLGSRIARRTALFAGLLLLVVAIQLPYQFGGTVKEILYARAKTVGIPLEIQEVTLHFPAIVELKGVGAEFPFNGFSIPFRAENLSLKPHLLRLLTLRGEGGLDFNAYGGRGAFSASKSFFSNSSNFDLTIHQLDLGQHPSSGLFGLKGKLSFVGHSTFTRDSAERTLIENTSAKLELDHGQYSGGHLIANTFPLPALSDLSLVLDLVQEAAFFRIRQLELLSSLGSLHGTGLIGVSAEGTVASANLSATAKLTNDGRKALGIYLALAAGRDQKEADRTEWLITFKLTPGGKPDLRVQPGSA